MRVPGASWVLAATGACALAAGACIDLFHSTELATLCDVDASADGCAAADASIDAPAPDVRTGPTAFCAWSSAQAKQHATHACAWLSACESPIGDNALGPCMIQATLAYDCAANPNRGVAREMRDYWDCLWQAASCAEVGHCVRPHDVFQCAASAGDYTQCDNAAAGGVDTSTRVACRGSASQGPPFGVESCVASGRTCARLPAGECNGSPSATCAASGCEGSLLHACDDAGVRDLGVDCRYFGGGTCVSSSAGGACLALGATTCSAGGDVTCDGGVAVGCPSGVRETVDCTLLGVGACGAATAAWDVASACDLGVPCTVDSCANGAVHSCARGAPFTADCAAAGLGPCHLVDLPNDAGTFAACAPPR